MAKRSHLTTAAGDPNLRELVFGVEDGLVSTLGAVIGIAAGSADSRIVILSGLVLVSVEALSMAAGSYLSNKSQAQLYCRRIEEERERIIRDPKGERAELRAMYRARGFSGPEIAILVKRITAKPELWLEEMVTKELKIGSVDAQGSPRIGALIMGVAYIAGGMVPVLPFFFLTLLPASAVAFGCTLCALFLVGVRKAQITGLSLWKSGFEMVTISMSAALVGFVIGRLVGNISGLQIAL